MLALVVSGCLTAAPATCSAYVVDWVPAVIIATCPARHHAEVTEWKLANPGVTVENIACMPARRPVSKP